MKKFLLLSFSLVTVVILSAQQNGSKLPPLDKSPMDMVYYPVNYPILKIQDKATQPLIARIIYSRPQKGHRTVFGELVEYGQVWRLGANEATEIEFFQNVRIANKNVPKGKYTVFAIVSPDKWTLIINKETDVWGAFKYDEKKDVVRATVPVQNLTESADAFTIFFEKLASGASIVFAWDDAKVSLPFSITDIK
jgi:hypothetical protein